VTLTFMGVLVSPALPRAKLNIRKRYVKGVPANVTAMYLSARTATSGGMLVRFMYSPRPM
jgi:hypothetical protein